MPDMQHSDNVVSHDEKHAIFVGAFPVQELSNVFVELLALARQSASSRHPCKRSNSTLNSGKPAIRRAWSAAEQVAE